MKDNLALDTARISIGMMTIDELRKTISIAQDRIEEKAEKHRIAIETAIAEALEEGFDINFWVEGTNDSCMMCHDDDRIKHVLVDQWLTPLIFLNCMLIKLSGCSNLPTINLTFSPNKYII